MVRKNGAPDLDARSVPEALVKSFRILVRIGCSGPDRNVKMELAPLPMYRAKKSLSFGVLEGLGGCGVA